MNTIPLFVDTTPAQELVELIEYEYKRSLLGGDYQNENKCIAFNNGSSCLIIRFFSKTDDNSC